MKANLLLCTVVTVASLTLANHASAQSPKPKGGSAAAGEAAATESASVIIKSVKGRAYAIRPDGRRIRLRAGMELPAGSQIQTGSLSSVDVFIPAAGASLQIGPVSDLKIERVNPAVAAKGATAALPGDVKLVLNSGELVGNSGAMKVGTKFEIVTPRGTVELRPSEFAIGRDSKLLVKTGSADYVLPTVLNSNVTATTTTVGANQELTPPAPVGPAKSVIALDIKVTVIPQDVKTELEPKFIEIARTQPTNPGQPQVIVTPVVQPPANQPTGGNKPAPVNTTTFDEIAKVNSQK